MKRQHLNRLAEVAGSIRDRLSPAEFESFLESLAEICAAANSAFDYEVFRAIAKRAKTLEVKAQSQVLINPFNKESL